MQTATIVNTPSILSHVQYHYQQKFKIIAFNHTTRRTGIYLYLTTLLPLKPKVHLFNCKQASIHPSIHPSIAILGNSVAGYIAAHPVAPRSYSSAISSPLPHEHLDTGIAPTRARAPLHLEYLYQVV